MFVPLRLLLLRLPLLLQSRKVDDPVAAAAGDESYEEDEDEGGGDGVDEYDRGTTGAPLDDEFEREYMSLMQVRGLDTE
jgi:hypothetical protein